jgi:ComF family protein
MFFIIKNFLAWLFPATCILCHNLTGRPQDLCLLCLNELPILPQNCLHCAKILTISEPVACTANLLEKGGVYALFRYEIPITKLILELKFHEKIVNARILGELMAAAIQNHWYAHQSLPDVIIPVPLHPKRVRERGFNQALELARPIAKALGLPLDTQSCQRLKHTAAQARMKVQDRAQNMRNVFAVTGDFSGRHVAVLDDVITTGHTLNEFTRMLQAAGAARVDIWCCARTLLH